MSSSQDRDGAESALERAADEGPLPGSRALDDAAQRGEEDPSAADPNAQDATSYQRRGLLNTIVDPPPSTRTQAGLAERVSKAGAFGPHG